MLPDTFVDLEPFPERWCLATEPQRYARRLAAPMEEMRALYDAVFRRVEDTLAYCNQYPTDAIPVDAQRLLQLLYSFVMVSFPVEV